MKAEIRYEIRRQDGTVRSRHTTWDAANKMMQRNLAWRCGVCGSTKGGWGACSHGKHQRVCSAEHYNDRIVEKEGKAMKFYKITNEEEKHNDMQYHDGLNEDVLPFNPSGDCKEGGIYFAREDILAFLGYGTWIREVTLPEGEPVYENPGDPKKWKAHRVILGKRRRITAKVVKEFIEEGANVHAGRDAALRWAAKYGQTETVKALLESGANVHANNDIALRCATEDGQTETVKMLLEAGTNVHAGEDDALRRAALNGHTETVKLLLDAGANVHAGEDDALRSAALNGHTETVKLLLDAGANVHAGRDAALRLAAKYGYTEMVNVLRKWINKTENRGGKWTH